MCGAEMKNNFLEKGTDLVFGPIYKISLLLRSFIPCGKVALIADGENNFLALKQIRAALKGFDCYCVIAGEREYASGLFSLPDDVRAAVAVGNGAFRAARYFCTLREAYCIVIPDGADLISAFEKNVSLSMPTGKSRYPADLPDAVYCDIALITNFDGAYGNLCLCALSALDLEIHSVFAGGDGSAPYRKLFEEAVKLNVDDKEEILSLSVRYALLQNRAEKRTAAELFCRLLQRKTKNSAGSAALFAFYYLTERYRNFFRTAVPRTYFVPDYARRIRLAAAYANENERELFLKNKVPAVRRQDALLQTFAESRSVFCRKAESVAVYWDKVKSNLLSLGASAPRVEPYCAHEAFSATAELADTLSVAALMRDFGLLR